MSNKKIKICLKDFDMAVKFIESTNSYVSDIDIYDGNTVLDAKSTCAVINLPFNKDLYVKIISDNIDECRRFDSEMEMYR